MQATTLNRWTVVHRWTSLFCTLNLLFLCLTGLILIFHEEINDALGTLPTVTHAAGAQPLPMSRLVDAARPSYPGWEPVIYFEDDEHPGRVFVSFAPPDKKADFNAAKPVIVNAFSGEIMQNFDYTKTFTGWVLKAHTDLFLGFFGQMYLALVGLAFFAALVSGAVVYAPFLRGTTFGALRRSRGGRVFQLDLHNLVGVVTLVWCSVVALTGVILELSRPAIAYYQYSDLAALTAPFRGRPAPTQIVPLEQAAAVAAKAWPHHRVQFAVFPGTALSGDYHYGFFMVTESGIAKRVFKITLIDAATGELTAAREAPWYIKALSISGPLHFGDYAGMPLKILWALFTLCTLGLCVGGVYLIVSRLRARRADASILPELAPAAEEEVAAAEALSSR